MYIKKITPDEAKELSKTGDYGCYTEMGAVIGNRELTIVWTSEFNDGNPCIVASNSIIKKGCNGIFVSLPEVE